MALKQIRIGALVDVFQYDDGDFSDAIETTEPIKAGAPVVPDHVLRLADLALMILPPVPVANIANPTELNTVGGTEGTFLIAYQAIGAASLNHIIIYSYDDNGPAVNHPWVVDAAGVGNERWVAVGGEYSVFDISRPTKNPPIDADSIVYQDSAAGYSFVTATWAQIKAFLKHAITSTTLHSSSATSGKMLKANADGLPVDATNTDAQVSSAVSASHTQGTDTALGALGTKNPPIDADKVIYRDSTSADGLVTSTWTQIKAFLKTYLDTLYLPYYTHQAFTPSLKFGGANTGMTGTFSGRYSAINNRVFFDILITLTAKGSATGSASISLPTTINNNGVNPSFILGYATNLAASTITQITVLGSNNTTDAYLWQYSAGASNPVTHADFTDTSVICIAGNFEY